MSSSIRAARKEFARWPTSAALWNPGRYWARASSKLDLEYWEQKRIPVANTPGQFSAVALAECALMYMIMLSRRWRVTQSKMEQGSFYNTLGSELIDRNLLLLGFGSSARELARR